MSNTRQPNASEGVPRWRSFGLLLVWAVGAVAVAWAGFLEDPYLRYVRHMQAPFPYPIGLVAGLVALMAVYVGLLQVILRPTSYRMSWGGALLAWVLTIGLLFTIAMGSMHAPPPLLACLWWITAVAVAMSGLLVVSAIRAWRA